MVCAIADFQIKRLGGRARACVLAGLARLERQHRAVQLLEDPQPCLYFQPQTRVSETNLAFTLSVLVNLEVYGEGQINLSVMPPWILGFFGF